MLVQLVTCIDLGTQAQAERKAQTKKTPKTTNPEGKSKRAVRLTCCTRSEAHLIWWKPLEQNGSTVNSNQDALDFVLSGLEVLHEQKFYRPSEQPIPVLEYTYNKEFSLKSS